MPTTDNAAGILEYVAKKKQPLIVYLGVSTPDQGFRRRSIPVLCPVLVAKPAAA